MKILILFAMLCGAAAADERWSLEALQPGAYVEDLGEIAVVEDKVEIFFRLNMTEIQTEIENIGHFRDEILTACNKISIHEFFADDCGHFFQISTFMQSELYFKFSKLAAERERRGAINIVGCTARYLFGTLDDEDRDEITSRLDVLERDNVDALKMGLKYSKLVEKAVANVNTSVEICNRNGRLISEVQTRFSSIVNSVNHQQLEIRFLKYFTDIVQTFYLSFQETKDRIDETHQTMIDLSNGIFNTRLISYNDIIITI